MIESHPMKLGELVRQLERHRSKGYTDIDDYEVWIEDVRRVGVAQPEVVLEHIGHDDQDYIESSVCTGIDHKNKRIYINHHI